MTDALTLLITLYRICLSYIKEAGNECEDDTT